MYVLYLKYVICTANATASMCTVIGANKLVAKNPNRSGTMELREAGFTIPLHGRAASNLVCIQCASCGSMQ